MTQHEHGEHYAVEPTALLSVTALATYLGISRWSVYRLVERGDIRTVRVGERLRFRMRDVEAYLERGDDAA